MSPALAGGFLTTAPPGKSEIVVSTQGDDGIGPARPETQSHSWASSRLETRGQGVRGSGPVEVVERGLVTPSPPWPLPTTHGSPGSDFLTLSLAGENTPSHWASSLQRSHFTP